MNNFIECLLFNIEYINSEKAYILNTDNKDNMYIKPYKIIFKKKTLKHEKKEIINIQFKIYTKFIKSVETKFDKYTKKFINISPDGFLVSFNFHTDQNDNNTYEFIFYPYDTSNIKPKIYIKKKTFDIYKPIDLVNINWDNIFVINLERRIDRKLNMINQFDLNNIKEFEFIDAIDGSNKLIIDKFNSTKLSVKTKIITSGHFACLLSHIKAIKEAKTRRYKSIMILEDDVFLQNNFINNIKKIKVPCYDMVYLGGIINKKKIFFSHWVINKKNILGAYGYILTSNLFDYILEELSKLIDYVDIFYMKNIQPNYRVILLDDFVKTNLESSDTSNKTLLMTQRLSYIKN